MGDSVGLALLFPFLGFLFNALLSRAFPRGLSGIVASLAVGLSFVVALTTFLALSALPGSQQFHAVTLWTWLVAGDLNVRIGLLVDPLSSLMLLVVTGVGFLIHVYAIASMHGDPGERRFFAYLNLFVLAMLVLVLADNFVLLMAGWNGVGLSSYLLIAFWFERDEAARAGVKAFVVNAIGDVGLLLAAFLIFVSYRTLDYDQVFKAAGAGGAVLTAISLLLLLAAVAKSAQLPLYVWLPDAMAGPTPVSALIHAATMVTAGVYLIARTHPIYTQSPEALGIVATIGALTALFAATVGLVKPNIKRVLAYSTVSQLGYMFLGVGVGAFGAGLFHLTTHAFFKALLFLAAGGAIHALGGEEDMRKMGGLRARLPLVYWTFVVGALALAGFPLFSGFWSKDEIITATFAGPRANPTLGVVALVTALLTAFYIFRAVFLTFHGKPHHHLSLSEHFHAPGPVMTVPLVILAGFAVVAGYVQVLGGSFGHFLQPVFNRYGPHEVAVALNPGLLAASATLSVVGIVLAYVVYGGDQALARRLGYQFAWLHQLLLNDYYIEDLYRLVIVRPVLAVAGFVGETFDRVVVDGAVGGVVAMVRYSGAALTIVQTGNLRGYGLGILTGAVVILAYLSYLGGWGG
ncbi:MAG: NADH-quinone oxidoreductase subunit L [Chloroflexi bacterium]|nr:NADH-quinone oxidoreductase subunit L [Chloroflexota bacterium]